jgi:hypothetical protein
VFTSTTCGEPSIENVAACPPAGASSTMFLYRCAWYLPIACPSSLPLVQDGEVAFGSGQPQRRVDGPPQVHGGGQASRRVVPPPRGEVQLAEGPQGEGLAPPVAHRQAHRQRPFQRCQRLVRLPASDLGLGLRADRVRVHQPVALLGEHAGGRRRDRHCGVEVTGRPVVQG